MEDHKGHHNEETDLCHQQQLYKKNSWCFGAFSCLKPSVMNGCGNIHVRCRWNRRFDRDAGDGLVSLTASQSTALHDKPYLELRRERKRGRQRNTWPRDLEADVKETGYSWRQLEILAKDRNAWPKGFDQLLGTNSQCIGIGQIRPPRKSRTMGPIEMPFGMFDSPLGPYEMPPVPSR